ncbi:fused sensory histidine kinase in two-component regulatory system with KdpE: signal sensing protein; sensory histidine kinase [Candidatus Sulfobium mesophilum]|uniref:histidine kinase n=1 Tax=Candidatus Sulfobium mesophilum TaxID=2016548 RepID=A0A2U3QJF4_9BACT|nr:fused sensory histidine kinase in two-component regulatory system with KdpE: signal sensing protein; sensory histidine kinase [Candidatus Sulfobium mesophilum]
MEERRPDPDLLLAEVRQEEDRLREGQLKIFFGAAPGVGKTYAMLGVAQQKLAEGIDIVAGVVETHGRKETETLLEGLQIIPRRSVEYRGAVLSEFDIDSALKRKPAIILVDELAHTNAPGSRHKKRWQDIYELLGAGISVYTTVNVQHLESLNDVVSNITGITVRETIPDFLLERADEIELVDLPPDDLLQRLRDGKVYVPELASKAREFFFRKGNLLALRELALRRTAQRVDEQMQRYREVKGVREVWPAAEKLLVCVGPNPQSIRLIRAAKRMAAGLSAEWITVYVEAPHKVKPSESDLRQLAEHMRLAESLGAETVTLSGPKASEEILAYARDRNVTKIVIGKPTHPRWKDKLFGSMLDELVRGSGDIEVYVISGDTGEPVKGIIAKSLRSDSGAKEWLFSLAVVVACSGLALLMKPYFEIVDLAMVYLLGVVIAAIKTERGPSLFAAFLSVAAFDFIFIPPYYTFAVSNVRYFITFIVMFMVAFIISRLTHRIRDQVYAARQREKRTTAMYNLSRKFVHERGIEKLCAIAIRHISEVLPSHVVVLVPADRGKLTIPATGQETFALDEKELSVAQWTFDHRQRAGLGTDTLSGARALYIPMVVASKAVGVIGILPRSSHGFFDQEQIHVLESLVNQVALAIDRAMISLEAQEALLKAETETLRNTLLSSVSHDLRTPLASITGAITTLLQKDIALDIDQRQELLQTIYEEAEHLNQIIRNVLDMTRLEAGAIKVKKVWLPIEEIIGAVLSRLDERLMGRQVRTILPEDLPLISFDPLLIEQVLVNLLDNAIKYTPPETPIELSAHVKDKEIIVEIADRGAGIPTGEEEKIFDKFVRGTATGGGIGLGLTICRAIIQAHGGRIKAENRRDGGAVFSFSLPLGDQPPISVP